jgi:hypothetical protein
MFSQEQFELPKEGSLFLNCFHYMKPTSRWKPNKVVNCTFILAGKDMIVWSKIGGHITDGNHPISVLHKASDREKPGH